MKMEKYTFLLLEKVSWGIYILLWQFWESQNNTVHGVNSFKVQKYVLKTVFYFQFQPYTRSLIILIGVASKNVFLRLCLLDKGLYLLLPA